MRAWWSFEKAQKCAALGAWRSATDLYQKALALDSSDATRWMWTGVAEAELGRYEQARERLEEALSRKRLPGIEALFLARILFDAGQTTEAERFLSAYLTRNHNEHGRALLAACLLRLGRTAEARELVASGLSFAPWALARLLVEIELVIPDQTEPPSVPLPEMSAPFTDPGRFRRYLAERRLRRGLVRLRSGCWEKALDAFRQAYPAMADDPRASYGLGVALYYIGHFAAAGQWLEPVLDRLAEPFWSDALATLGKIDLELGRPLEALLRLRRAIVAGAAHEENYYALGIAMLRCGKLRQARRFFERCATPELIRERWPEAKAPGSG